MKLFALALSLVGASALVVNPLVTPATAAHRVAVSPAMACNGGVRESAGTCFSQTCRGAAVLLLLTPRARSIFA